MSLDGERSRDAPSASCGERSPFRGGPIDSNLTAHFCTRCVVPPSPSLFKLRFSLDPLRSAFSRRLLVVAFHRPTLQMPSTPPIQLVTRFLHSTEIWAFATKYGSQFPFFPFVASVSLIARHRRGDTDLCPPSDCGAFPDSQYGISVCRVPFRTCFFVLLVAPGSSIEGRRVRDAIKI